MMILTIRSNPKSGRDDVGLTVAPQGYQSKI
jgi:hypothetical protein